MLQGVYETREKLQKDRGSRQTPCLDLPLRFEMPSWVLRSGYAKGNLHRQSCPIGHLDRGIQTRFPFNEGRYTIFPRPETAVSSSQCPNVFRE